MAAPFAAADSKQEHDRAFFSALYEATDGNPMQMSRRAEINRETVRTYVRALGIGGYAKD